ncbi:MAG: alpha/beta fold hydrolase [Deltaproteobacteria bacterium]
MTHLSRRAVLSGLAVVPLAACGQRAQLLGNGVPTAQGARVRRVHVASTRAPSLDPKLAFDGDRSSILRFSSIDVSIPPNRTPGDIPLPRAPIDATKQFLAISRSQPQDIATWRRDIAGEKDGTQSVVLFVHGYNASHPEAVFRAAQVADDFGLTEPVALFSWPSAGKAALYAYDRDSVLFARDALSETLRELAKSRTRDITILAHSMGALLTMEAIRNLTLQGDHATLNRLSGIILAEPDIDLDVFRTQIALVDLDRTPVAVFVSKKDRILGLSTFIAGNNPRVGRAENIPELQKLGVVVIDVSGATDGAFLGHSAFATSPRLLAIIRSGQLGRTVLSGPRQTNLLLSGAQLVTDTALAVVYLPDIVG